MTLWKSNFNYVGSIDKQSDKYKKQKNSVNPVQL